MMTQAAAARTAAPPITSPADYIFKSAKQRDTVKKAFVAVCITTDLNLLYQCVENVLPTLCQFEELEKKK
ncbi:hypothetical protein [Hydrogenoanaerobacterium sp.]|uniref:hypothetical protein n=1 Tax=Hydrogenoanaerobacterium sp. TaxID=2953763 RepID=UPI0028A1E19F|nr:hypothetical protein [Hydrogenoanaerobacterium sp.]